MSKNDKKSQNDRTAGLAEGSFIAPTGTSISSVKEVKMKQAAAAGMTLGTMVVRFAASPEQVLRVLGKQRRDIPENEWHGAQVAYVQSKDPIRNELRGGLEPYSRERGRDIMF